MVRRETSRDRLPWEDQFNRPSLARLRQGLPTEDRPLFDAAVESLESICGRKRTIRWHGTGVMM